MPIIQPDHVNEAIDKLVGAYQRLKGVSGQPFGAGDGTFGASELMEDIDELVEGSLVIAADWRDSDLQIPLGAGAAALASLFDANNLFAGSADGWVSTLSNVCSLARTTVDPEIIDLDTYLFYYNVTDSVKWQALQAPDWREMFRAMKGRHPRPKNLYFPVMQGMTYPTSDPYPNGLYKVVLPGPTETDGATIDHTKYAGGFAHAKWTGGNGSGAASIVVTGKDENGNVESWQIAGTWGSGPFTASQPGVQLLPQGNPNALITDVTSVAFQGITDGTFYFEARPPTGRAYPLI